MIFTREHFDTHPEGQWYADRANKILEEHLKYGTVKGHAIINLDDTQQPKHNLGLICFPIPLGVGKGACKECGK